jgi:hypothetical protein
MRGRGELRQSVGNEAEHGRSLCLKMLIGVEMLGEERSTEANRGHKLVAVVGYKWRLMMLGANHMQLRLCVCA